MTTIINTPPTVDSSDSGLGIILGVIVALLLIVIFFVYGLPYIRNVGTDKDDSININVKLPTSDNTQTNTTNP